ncbi:rhodanese-like domain-containing protein [Marixanthomonas spongiae]|uniref:Rhodanese-like domain-containing protein n=1 Tax=Marixanthomonas spongiae TaxID=2174845 RepID=A0A2U0I8A1_9FLAO|nr:rhodanese-like domain-containing protein [Marixanthomonas spongiae]PVW17332.1 rhodanese-like domain-containing protein [Marixanthomonas spongiae]
MKHLLYFFLLLISISGFSQQRSLEDLLQQYNTRSIPYISVEELRMKQMNDSVVILDAREQKEYNVSHIASAKYVGFSKFSIDSVANRIPNKNTPIVVYCSLGIRSEEISEKLKKAGYTNIENLYGGIFEWKNKDYPTVNNQGKETDSIHGFSKNWSKWLDKGPIIIK